MPVLHLDEEIDTAEETYHSEPKTKSEPKFSMRNPKPKVVLISAYSEDHTAFGTTSSRFSLYDQIGILVRNFNYSVNGRYNKKPTDIFMPHERMRSSSNVIAETTDALSISNLVLVDLGIESRERDDLLHIATLNPSRRLIPFYEVWSPYVSPNLENIRGHIYRAIPLQENDCAITLIGKTLEEYYEKLKPAPGF